MQQRFSSVSTSSSQLNQNQQHNLPSFNNYTHTNSYPPHQNQNPSHLSSSSSSSLSSPSAIADHYLRFTQTCKKANEAFSQAESTCSQYSLQTKKFGQQVQLAHTIKLSSSAASTTPEDLNARFEQLIQNCQDACGDAKQMPMWGTLSFETLQSLSPIQRQKLESQKSEINDLERQIRVLVNRHSMNVQKWMSSKSVGNENGGGVVAQSNNNNNPDHVSRVLQNGTNNNKFYAGADFNPDTATEDDYKRKERESLTRVVSGVRQMVSESNAVLGALRQQRARMLDTDNKLTSVLSGAGVAQSVVRQLERMTAMDKAIVFGGIGFLTVFMIFLWFFM